MAAAYHTVFQHALEVADVLTSAMHPKHRQTLLVAMTDWRLSQFHAVKHACRYLVS